MKEFIQLLLMLTPTWASARLSPGHKNERKKFLYILLFLPYKALSKTVKKTSENNLCHHDLVCSILFLGTANKILQWGNFKHQIVSDHDTGSLEG